MAKLLRRMRKREILLAVLCALLVLGQIYFDLRLPDYMSDLTVLVKTPGSATSEIWNTGLQMLACALSSAVLCVVCGYLAARVAAGFSYTIRREVFEKVTDFGQEQMLSFSVPSLINRTTNDITQIQMLLAMGLQIFIKAPVMAVWAVLKIIDKSWQLSLITAAFVVGLLALMIVLVVIIVPRMRRVQKLTDRLNLVARENLTGIRVVHAFNAEDYQNEKFDRASEELTRTQLFNQRGFALLPSTVTLAMNALALTIYWVGASLINQVSAADSAARIATFGNVVVFGTYATYVVMSIMMLVMIVMFLPAAQVSAQRIGEVLETSPSILPGKRSDAPEQGTVEFRNVSFRYPDASQDALQDISFRAEKGQTLAFIGATGSGKTTLVNLLARFYDVTDGQVLLDGVDVRDYTFDALYNRLGYVPQRAVLFSGDISSNILFGRSAHKPDENTVQQALDLAQAQEFVSKLDDGIHAPIAQEGANVSGGQKQRLAIARALARKPEVLIFDDSFSALDYQTDAALRRALAKELSGVTCLIVAQRIGTIRHADQIVVLDEGRAVGVGRHEELMRTCPVYRQIAMSQLSAEELGEQGRDL